MNPAPLACLQRFCDVIVQGGEEGDVFVNIRQEVIPFAAQLQDPTPDTYQAIVEFMDIPNHHFACCDLDYKRFSTSPMVANGKQLHVYHILEVFSRTNPQRFAMVWEPLLDFAALTQSGDGAHKQALAQAKQHVAQQQQKGVDGAGALTASPDAQIDNMVQNLMGSCPGGRPRVDWPRPSSGAAEHGTTAHGHHQQ